MITNLTEREKQILTLTLNGDAPIKIASDLGLAETTVYTHRRSATLKMGVKTPEHAAVRAKRRGLI